MGRYTFNRKLYYRKKYHKKMVFNYRFSSREKPYSRIYDHLACKNDEGSGFHIWYRKRNSTRYLLMNNAISRTYSYYYETEQSYTGASAVFYENTKKYIPNGVKRMGKYLGAYENKIYLIGKGSFKFKDRLTPYLFCSEDGVYFEAVAPLICPEGVYTSVFENPLNIMGTFSCLTSEDNRYVALVWGGNTSSGDEGYFHFDLKTKSTSFKPYQLGLNVGTVSNMYGKYSYRRKNGISSNNYILLSDAYRSDRMEDRVFQLKADHIGRFSYAHIFLNSYPIECYDIENNVVKNVTFDQSSNSTYDIYGKLSGSIPVVVRLSTSGEQLISVPIDDNRPAYPLPLKYLGLGRVSDTRDSYNCTFYYYGGPTGNQCIPLFNDTFLHNGRLNNYANSFEIFPVDNYLYINNHEYVYSRDEINDYYDTLHELLEYVGLTFLTATELASLEDLVDRRYPYESIVSKEICRYPENITTLDYSSYVRILVTYTQKPGHQTYLTLNNNNITLRYIESEKHGFMGINEYTTLSWKTNNTLYKLRDISWEEEGVREREIFLFKYTPNSIEYRMLTTNLRDVDIYIETIYFGWLDAVSASTWDRVAPTKLINDGTTFDLSRLVNEEIFSHMVYKISTSNNVSQIEECLLIKNSILNYESEGRIDDNNIILMVITNPTGFFEDILNGVFRLRTEYGFGISANDMRYRYVMENEESMLSQYQIDVLKKNYDQDAVYEIP